METSYFRILDPGSRILDPVENLAPCMYDWHPLWLATADPEFVGGGGGPRERKSTHGTAVGRTTGGV